MRYILEIYETMDGKHPFNTWLTGLKDIQTRQKVRVRLERLALGNLSNSKALANGVHEIKLDFGPGYRIYYTKVGPYRILILWAGTKRTQDKDIETSKNYFFDYKIREKGYAEK